MVGAAAISAGDELARADVDAAIAKLDRLRTSAPIAPFYEDGSRLEGCWRNPAGSKLTDLQKAYYCSMPLEFRICNTVVLLTVGDSEVEKRLQGYLDCQKKVDGVFGGHGRFIYDDDINATYETLFLRGVTPTTTGVPRTTIPAEPSGEPTDCE